MSSAENLSTEELTVFQRPQRHYIGIYYRVLCVCDSKERAKAIAALPGTDSYGDGLEVEEIVYIDREPQRVTVHGLSEELMDSGAARNRREDSRAEWEFDMLYPYTEAEEREADELRDLIRRLFDEGE